MASRSWWRSEAVRRWAGVVVVAVSLAGCAAPPAPKPKPTPVPPPLAPPTPPPIAARPSPPLTPAVAAAVRGEEIIAAGLRFPAGTRIVTWLEPDGYNAYKGTAAITPRAKLEKERNDFPALQRTIDQFVLHYDGAGLSRVCFSVLQQRKLSVHFLLDVDGTIYQTLDLQERAAHATIANDRSIGIEIANPGAYPPAEAAKLAEWYKRDRKGGTRLTVPARFRNLGIRTPNFVARPARPERISGKLQNLALVQYDFTPEQYAALAKLTAALCRVFPRLRCDYPNDPQGRLLARQLSEKEWENYRGVLGHFHVQANKVDPGPAFQWQKFIEAAQKELGNK